MSPHPIVVVKVGSSSLTGADGRLDSDAVASLAAQLAAAAADGARPVLVTSGAIAAGAGSLARPRDTDITAMQALAAVGQGVLMATYAQAFAEYGLHVGQVLFTGHDFGARATYLNARATLRQLLEWGAVPIVNENDTTATEEISLGENDRLAALVATMMRADLLLILTDTAGIFSADPRLTSTATLIEEVAEVDAQLEAVAGASVSGIGTGGMASKVAAARIASWSGVTTVVAAATEPDVIARALRGEGVGTRVHARPQRLTARKVWLAFALRPCGAVHVDAGAVHALNGGASLLAVGVRRTVGEFAEGDPIEVRGPDGDLVAKGLARIASRSLDGDGPGDSPVVIHRDDMVVLDGARPTAVS